MKNADTLKELSNEALVTELQRRSPQLPDALKQQLSATLAEQTRPRVEGALSAVEAEKRELSPEWAERNISMLKFRFEAPENEKLRREFDFAEVESSLRANPEALFSVQKLEETGGELQVVGIEGDEFIFEDRSAESPSERRNLNFDEADAQRKSFGPNVRFQSFDSYRAMQNTRNWTFDMNSHSWLETDDEVRESGNAMFGDNLIGDEDYYESDAGARDPNCGWRASLRVKKA